MLKAVEIDSYIFRLNQASADVDHISAIEVSRLLDRAIDIIRELRERQEVVMYPEEDALIYLRTASAGANWIEPEEWHHALRHAADVIKETARSGGAMLIAASHVGVVAWSRDADPSIGEYGPPVILFQAGEIPDGE